MDCATAREALNNHRVDEAAQAHLEHCPICALTLTSAEAAQLDLDALAALQTQQDAERSPLAWLRNQRTRTRLLASLLITGAVLALVALTTRRVNFSLYPQPRMALELIALLAITALATQFALWPLHRRPIPRARLLALVAGLGLPLVLSLAPAAHVAHPASAIGAGADFAARALACLTFGVIVGLPLLATVLLARRSHQRPTGPALAAIAGSTVGVAALLLHCPITEPMHLLAGHAPVALVLAALTLGAGWLWRTRRPTT